MYLIVSLSNKDVPKSTYIQNLYFLDLLAFTFPPTTALPVILKRLQPRIHPTHKLPNTTLHMHLPQKSKSPKAPGNGKQELGLKHLIYQRFPESANLHYNLARSPVRRFASNGYCIRNPSPSPGIVHYHSNATSLIYMHVNYL